MTISWLVISSSRQPCRRQKLSPCPGRAGFIPWVPLPPSLSPVPPWQCRWLLASPGSLGVLSPAELCWSHLPPDVTSFPSCSRNFVNSWSFRRLFVLLVFPEHISWHTFTHWACRFPKLSVTTGVYYIPIYPYIVYPFPKQVMSLFYSFNCEQGMLKAYLIYCVNI